MIELAPNIYVSTDYPEVNVGFVVGPAGVIAIDAPTLPEDARAWRQRIEQTAGPILYTVLTDAHPHRLLCAGLLGAPLVTTRAAYAQAADYTGGFWRNVVRRLSKRYPEAEEDLGKVDPQLPEVLFDGRLRLYKSEKEVTLVSTAGASPGVAWVDLRDEDSVLFTGDSLVVGEPPAMDTAPNTRDWLRTLSTLRRPRFSEVTLVPGRGPISDQSATRPLSEYIRTARRRVRSLHRTGRPEEDVKEFIDELLIIASHHAEEEKDWFRKRIEDGLERIYEELQPEDDGSG
jgi:glyoxylase-like metal-dependent hydrolase (beta-lactamase superfamily II)